MLLDKVTPVMLVKTREHSQSSCYLVGLINLIVMHILFYLSIFFPIGFYSKFSVVFCLLVFAFYVKAVFSFVIQGNIKNSTVLASRCNQGLLNS